MSIDSDHESIRALSARPRPVVDAVDVFVYLQLLDLMTTVLGLRLGLGEASPFVRWLMGIGPAAGVLISKGVALALGAICLAYGRQRLVVWINYWFAALVVWNLTLMIHSQS